MEMWIFLGVVLILFLSFIAWMQFWDSVLLPFKRKSEYLKMEAKRTSGTEKKYWQRMLREHYISALPVVRTIYRKFM